MKTQQEAVNKVVYVLVCVYINFNVWSNCKVKKVTNEQGSLCIFIRIYICITLKAYYLLYYVYMSLHVCKYIYMVWYHFE